MEIYLGALVAGIGATVTPCILPLYPAFLAYLTNRTAIASDAVRLAPAAAALRVWAGVVTGMLAIGAAIGVATTVLAAFGVSSGIVVRMLRNDLLPVIAFLVLMVVGAVATLVWNTEEERGRWVAGFVLFFLSVFSLTGLAGQATQSKERPQVLTSSEILANGLAKLPLWRPNFDVG
jgi:cytochrome c biogenesis protein CcdA